MSAPSARLETTASIIIQTERVCSILYRTFFRQIYEASDLNFASSKVFRLYKHFPRVYARNKSFFSSKRLKDITLSPQIRH